MHRRPYYNRSFAPRAARGGECEGSTGIDVIAAMAVSGNKVRVRAGMYEYFNGRTFAVLQALGIAATLLATANASSYCECSFLPPEPSQIPLAGPALAAD